MNYIRLLSMQEWMQETPGCDWPIQLTKLNASVRRCVYMRVYCMFVRDDVTAIKRNLYHICSAGGWPHRRQCRAPHNFNPRYEINNLQNAHSNKHSCISFVPNGLKNKITTKILCSYLEWSIWHVCFHGCPPCFVRCIGNGLRPAGVRRWYVNCRHQRFAYAMPDCSGDANDSR